MVRQAQAKLSELAEYLLVYEEAAQAAFSFSAINPHKELGEGPSLIVNEKVFLNTFTGVSNAIRL